MTNVLHETRRPKCVFLDGCIYASPRQYGVPVFFRLHLQCIFCMVNDVVAVVGRFSMCSSDNSSYQHFLISSVHCTCLHLITKDV